MGLGYPGLTSNFVNNKRQSYDPIFTTMYKDGLSSAMFSMAIQRGSNGGYIAFGGLPPVAYDANSWAKTTIKKTTIFGSGLPQYGFYTMVPDAIVYPGAPAIQSENYIVDSGTTLMYAPTAVANAINKLITPPSTDGQTFSCNATAPAVGIKIGGKTFNINPADMLLDAGNGLCISGIQGTSSAPYILGDTFMKNVVVAFDVGAAEMRFAASQY
jgi:Eukaryotic aspartyl protease